VSISTENARGSDLGVHASPVAGIFAAHTVVYEKYLITSSKSWP
jgi:hypothetical protein